MAHCYSVHTTHTTNLIVYCSSYFTVQAGGKLGLNKCVLLLFFSASSEIIKHFSPELICSHFA